MPNKELWQKPSFEKVLSDRDGNITADGLKEIVEHQRLINGKFYEAILLIIAGKSSDAASLVAEVPGEEPPGCPGSN